MRLKNNDLWRRLNCQPIPETATLYYLDGAAYNVPPYGRRICVLAASRDADSYLLSHSNEPDGVTLVVSRDEVTALDGDATDAEVLEMATEALAYLPRPSSECRGL